MESIILFILGVFLGWIGSWYFSKDTNKKLDELKKSFIDFTSELIHIKNTTDKLMPLIPQEKIAEVSGITKELNESIANLTKEVKEVNISQNLNLDTSSLEMICPKCNIPMLDYGYRPTSYGYVWHYKCPKCELVIEGGSTKDMMD